MSRPDWRDDAASFAQWIDGSGGGFRCIEQTSRDVSLPSESLPSEDATSEPESILWESSACIGPSAKGPPDDVAGRSRFRIL